MVNLVDVFEVCGCCLIGNVDGVCQWQIPNGESFKLCISAFDALLLVVIELAKTSGKFSTAGAGGCAHNKASCGFNVGVCAVSFI